MWFVLKKSKNDFHVDKMIKALSNLLNMDNFDYILSHADFDYAMAIANRY
jgi:hypothetical protein